MLKEFIKQRQDQILTDFIEMLRSDLPRNGFTDVIITEPEAEEWQRLDFV